MDSCRAPVFPIPLEFVDQPQQSSSLRPSVLRRHVHWLLVYQGQQLAADTHSQIGRDSGRRCQQWEWDADQRNVAKSPLFVENPFLLCCSDALAWTNTDIDSTSKSNRWRIGGLYRDHSNFLALQHPPFNVQRGRRHNISIGFISATARATHP